MYVLARLRSILLLVVVFACATAAARPVWSAPLRAGTFDTARRIDANTLSVFGSNVGTTGLDLATGGPGFVYPRGTNGTVISASGLWLCGFANGNVLTAIANDRGQEFAPGTILANGSADNPDALAYRVYKMARWTGLPSDSAHVERSPGAGVDVLVHHSWSEYVAGAAPYGAPTRVYRLPATATPAPDDSIDVVGPDVSGDQMLWAVYNDANPIYHTNPSGGTNPLGVEVRQTTWAYDRPGALGNTLFMRYHITNWGASTITNFFVSQWVSTATAGLTLNLVGSDPARATGYAYDAWPVDESYYGTSPPAAGVTLLRGPLLGGEPVGAGAFTAMLPGASESLVDTWYAMRGTNSTGGPQFDPVTGAPTTFQLTGDPLANKGWLDDVPNSRAMLLTTKPVTLLPGASTEVTFALVVARESYHLASLAALRCAIDQVRSSFASGFSPTSPPVPCPFVAINCPGSATFWQQAYAAGGSASLTHAQLEAIASRVDLEAGIWDWSTGTPFNELKVVLAAQGDARTRAKRDYAALLANVSVRRLSFAPESGGVRYLNPRSGITCSAIEARTIEAALAPGSLQKQLLTAEYHDLNTIHPEPFDYFGAGIVKGFLGSSLDPVAHPDSFPHVEIRFSHTILQKAYRYLRLETASGGQPSGGRKYSYGGFRLVPFRVWDVDHDRQLDAGFVERTITDASGTILPPESQVATFDSTWAPDTSQLGGREYLVVFNRPYSSTPKPFFEQNGIVNNNACPSLYYLFPKLKTATSWTDHGDLFDYTFGVPLGTVFEQDFIALEDRPLSDPAVTAVYTDLKDCLASINAGVGVGTMCGNPPGVDVPPGESGIALATLDLAPPRPNPASDALTVSLVLPARGPATLQVLDVAGRRVWTREVGALGPGRHVVKLELGARIPPGVYFVRLTQGARAANRKLALVR